MLFVFVAMIAAARFCFRLDSILKLNEGSADLIKSAGQNLWSELRKSRQDEDGGRE